MHVRSRSQNEPRTLPVAAEVGGRKPRRCRFPADWPLRAVEDFARGPYSLCVQTAARWGANCRRTTVRAQNSIPFVQISLLNLPFPSENIPSAERPISARNEDGTSSTDLYRTYVGPSEGKFAFVVLAMVFGAIAAIGLLVAIVVNAR